MSEERADIEDATALVRWLLERGVDGLGLTKTHALQRAIVRETAERWPHWWRHELFGPPHREAELPVLKETHAGLRRLRLLRRQREALLTTARGRELLADPQALLRVLHEDLGGKGFEGDAWLLIEEVLRQQGPLESDRMRETVGRLLIAEGWRDADGVPLEGWALVGALQPVLCRAEGYGLLRRHGTPLTLELTAAAHRLAASEPAAEETIAAEPGYAALVFDAELVNVRGVSARVAVPERRPLTALHDAIQEAFGWFDDHLYSFWLDGRFWGEVEVTSPVAPDEAERTADVPIAELDLRIGQRIAYVFDFGDEWRVRLTVRERVTAAGDQPRVLALRGTPPPQYA
jgi:Plasmid pRiA4b ORF-3-like protein